MEANGAALERLPRGVVGSRVAPRGMTSFFRPPRDLTACETYNATGKERQRRLNDFNSAIVNITVTAAGSMSSVCDSCWTAACTLAFGSTV